MKKIKLFTDGSVNTQSKIGYGAYLTVPEETVSFDSLKTKVKIKRFEQTSSTRLELQTLLWALNTIDPSEIKIIIHTDSQNIVGLPSRRKRFEENNYRSKKGKLLNNHELYQKFYSTIDQFNCEFIKVQGHQASHQKTKIDQLFTLVDRAARNAQRKEKTKG